MQHICRRPALGGSRWVPKVSMESPSHQYNLYTHNPHYTAQTTQPPNLLKDCRVTAPLRSAASPLPFSPRSTTAIVSLDKLIMYWFRNSVRRPAPMQQQCPAKVGNRREWLQRAEGALLPHMSPQGTQIVLTIALRVAGQTWKLGGADWPPAVSEYLYAAGGVHQKEASAAKELCMRCPRWARSCC